MRCKLPRQARTEPDVFCKAQFDDVKVSSDTIYGNCKIHKLSSSPKNGNSRKTYTVFVPKKIFYTQLGLHPQRHCLIVQVSAGRTSMSSRAAF